jgi:hypothetical protein
VNRPPAVHPIDLTLDELAVIIEYTRTVPPADLGTDLGMN